MYDEDDLTYSPLQRTYSADGHQVEIRIYRMPDTEWSLEVVDEHNNSTVWDDLFATDEEALAEALQDLKDEGIHAFIGMGPEEAMH
jgi:hypothetical protein